MIANAAYQDYLDSPDWWATRKRAVARAGYRCERCGARGPFEVHHVTYCAVGSEAVDHLEVLCPACHRAEHLPRNRALRIRERLGQARLFPRWNEDDDLAVAA